MRRTAVVAAALAVVLFVVGVDLLHCLVIAAVVLTVGLLVTSLAPVELVPDPDPLPIGYTTTLLRSITFTDPRSTDPLGEAAGRRACQVYDLAAAQFPDDPVLAGYRDRPPQEWRFLAQRDLVRLLDRIDALTGSQTDPQTTTRTDDKTTTTTDDPTTTTTDDQTRAATRRTEEAR